MMTLTEKRQNTFGNWITETVVVLRIFAPQKTNTSMGNWAVDYDVPSTLGNTGFYRRTEFFFTKKKALMWIQQIENSDKSVLIQ